MVKRISNAPILILTASTMFLLVACHDRQPRGKAATDALPAAAVRVQIAELQPVIVSEQVVGTIRAKTRTTLQAKYPGRIDKFPVKLGDEIRAGDLVVELDARETKARLEQAEASLEQAERDWKRVSSLFSAQSATRAELDAAETRVRAARGAVAEARAILSQAQILAPFDGVVTMKWGDAGDLALPGKPLVDIENPSVLQVEIDIPESLSAQVNLHAPMAIIGPHGQSTTGLVTELARAVDPITRTRRAKIELQQPSLASGQFVRVSIPLPERNAIVLPKSAVLERGQLEMVFTVQTQHARMHLVKVRPQSDGRVEILSGVSAGQSVIVEGAEALIDGQRVEVK